MAQSTCSAEGCERPRRYRALWCNKHRQRVRKHGSPDHERWPDALSRFLSRVDPVVGGCWLWTGSGTGRDYEYAQFWYGGNVLAHRFAYEAFLGSVPVGLELDHLCTVKKCVNPLHLEPVTTAENMRRMRVALKGRNTK